MKLQLIIEVKPVSGVSSSADGKLRDELIHKFQSESTSVIHKLREEFTAYKLVMISNGYRSDI